MTLSSSEPAAPLAGTTAAGGKSSFSLWPLPDLGARATAIWNDGVTGTLSEEEIYDRGYAAGVRAAQVEAEQERISVIDEVRSALAGRVAQREEELQIVSENTYAIAVAVARQVIHRAMAEDDSVIRDMVHRAIEVADLSGKLEIRMHPEDLARICDDVNALNEDGELRKINWVGDESLPRGSCEVDSRGRLVDGGVDAALANLYRRLRDE